MGFRLEEQLIARLNKNRIVICGKSRWGGKRAWRIDSIEFLHMESNDTMDVRLTWSIIKSLKASQIVSRRRGRSDWVKVRVESKDAFEAAWPIVERAIDLTALQLHQR